MWRLAKGFAVWKSLIRVRYGVQAMYDNPYASSLETRIFSATPMELVQMLYKAAIEGVQTARYHLKRGEVVERGRAVTKTVAILAELNSSLDHAKGGELSASLAALYDYLQRTLLDANFRQADDGLAEAEKLLKTLDDAWSKVNAPQVIGSTRPDRLAEVHPISYGIAEIPYPLGGYARVLEGQWSA
jgi:flagellar protein FliS